MYRFAEVTHIFKILGFYRIAAIRILMVFHKDNFLYIHYSIQNSLDLLPFLTKQTAKTKNF